MRSQEIGEGFESEPGKIAHEQASRTAALCIDAAVAQDSIQQKAAVYDASGDQHYDHASALIKSIRGSDPDAAFVLASPTCSTLAKILDSSHVALRFLASEDIGNADPRAIMIAGACFDIVERIGMPEARITLGQTVTYLALAPKSNASYVAIDEAMKDVAEGRTIPVPMHIKDGNVRKATQMSVKDARASAGEGYKYAHTDGTRDDNLGMIGLQDYLGVEKNYYRPTDSGYEKQLADALARAKQARSSHNPGSNTPKPE